MGAYVNFPTGVSWPCMVAAWLPIATTASTNIVLTKSSKAEGGTWLSTGRNDDILSVHPPNLRIKLSCGRVVLVGPLTKRTLSIALVSPTHLIIATIGSTMCGSFACIFSNATDAMRCTATIAHHLKASRIQGPRQIRQKITPEQLLLESTASEPESVGSYWWSDFSLVVNVLEEKWREQSACTENNILKQFYMCES